MPRRLATGRPGSRALPNGWAEAHRHTAQTLLTGSVALTRPTAASDVWNAADGQVERLEPAPFYDGPCRVQSTGDRVRAETEVAGDRLAVAAYLIVVPASVTPAVGDIAVLAATDPVLDGRALRVARVVAGSERFERDLYCVIAD